MSKKQIEEFLKQLNEKKADSLSRIDDEDFEDEDDSEEEDKQCCNDVTCPKNKQRLYDNNPMLKLHYQAVVWLLGDKADHVNKYKLTKTIALKHPELPLFDYCSNLDNESMCKLLSVFAVYHYALRDKTKDKTC